MKDAFRQICVEWSHCPEFGYAFRDLVLVDRRLQLGWRNNPGFWCLFSAALQHSHVNTSFHNAVATPFGRAATSHVQASSPAEGESPVSLPPGYRMGEERRSCFLPECTLTTRYLSSRSVPWEANDACGHRRAWNPTMVDSSVSDAPASHPCWRRKSCPLDTRGSKCWDGRLIE